MARNKTGSYLPVLEAFIVVTVIIAALDAAAGLFDALTTENVFGLAVPLPGDGVQDLVPSNVMLERARAVVDAPTGLGFRLAWWLVGGGTSILVVIGGLVLRKIIATARIDDPFVADNVRRLRVLAALALGHGVLTMARAGVEVAIQKDIAAEHVSTRISGSSQFVAALVLLALAEVWQRGVALRQDQDLTV